MENNWRFRFERHKKACKTCEHHYCTINCNNCEINPFDDIRSCPCLSPDDSNKYARCKYYKSRKEE